MLEGALPALRRLRIHGSRDPRLVLPTLRPWRARSARGSSTSNCGAYMELDVDLYDRRVLDELQSYVAGEVAVTMPTSSLL